MSTLPAPTPVTNMFLIISRSLIYTHGAGNIVLNPPGVGNLIRRQEQWLFFFFFFFLSGGKFHLKNALKIYNVYK